MGSTMDSRYWVCRECCRQFDWNTQADTIKSHSCGRMKAETATRPQPTKKQPSAPAESPKGCFECAYGRVAGCWRCGSGRTP
jgi:hypothetical protein